MHNIIIIIVCAVHIDFAYVKEVSPVRVVVLSVEWNHSITELQMNKE